MPKKKHYPNKLSNHVQFSTLQTSPPVAPMYLNTNNIIQNSVHYFTISLSQCTILNKTCCGNKFTHFLLLFFLPIKYLDA